MWPFAERGEPEHPKVLILVLSALRDPWGHMMRVQMETWEQDYHPQTETMFYLGKGDPMPYLGYIGSRLHFFFSPNHGEELEEIVHRTREAFEHALALEWDFMARVHSSGYIHKQNLVDFVESGIVPSENLFCGLLTTGEKPFLWGGGSYILSRDVVQKFVEAKARWNTGIMEDNSMTELAQELNIPLNREGRMCSLNKINDSYSVMCYGIGENFSFQEHEWPEIKRVHPHWVFRVKQDERRHEDLDIMKKLKIHYQ